MPKSVDVEVTIDRLKKHVDKVSTQAYAKTMDEIIYDRYNFEIVYVLNEIGWAAPEGLRYNQLYREVNKLREKKDQKTIPWKTFDAHLKRLCTLKVVERIEKGRHEVRYRLKFFDEIRKFWIEKMKFMTRQFRDTVLLTWPFLKKECNLSDEDAARAFLGLLITNFEYTILTMIDLATQLRVKADTVQIGFLLGTTYQEFLENTLLAVEIFANIPAARKELKNFVDNILESHKAVKKKRTRKYTQKEKQEMAQEILTEVARKLGKTGMHAH